MTSTELSKVVGAAFYGRFRTLRDAQRDAIGPILKGEDVLILSRTGSGKTEAAVAPLLDRLSSAARLNNGIVILYITPTRALANDLLRRLEGPFESLGFNVGVRHGERNDVSRATKPNLLITTIESLDVMLSTNEIALKTIQAVVLDEVHLTYNTQRGLQLAILLTRLERVIDHPLQVVGLSATVGEPSDLWSFFRPSHTFTPIVDTNSRQIDYHINETSTPAALIEVIRRLSEGHRTKALLFTNSRRECDFIASQVRNRTPFGDQVFVHHSSLSRESRLNAEKSFQEADSALCIATSTLELGIDIGDIDLVLLYGHPGGWESFLQRIGRGNRRANKSNVLCLASTPNTVRFLSLLGFEALISQVTSGRMEREQPMSLLGAVAQQLLSILLERQGAFMRVADLVDNLVAVSHLDRSTVDAILARLASDGFIQEHGFQHRYGGANGLHRLLDMRLVWGNFPARSRDVRIMVAGRELGSLPAVNLMRLLPGARFRFAGRIWRVNRASPNSIEVEASQQAASTEVIFPGSRPSLDPSNVEEMLHVLESGLRDAAMSRETREWFLATSAALQPYVSSRQISFFRDLSGYHYFTFAGTVVNATIARWAGAGSFTAGDVELVSDRQIDFANLPTVELLEPFALDSLNVPEALTLFQLALPPNLLQEELAQVWRNTPVFQRSLLRLRASQVIDAPRTLLLELAQ